MRFTDQEKDILTTLTRLKKDYNRLKLPTISAYMQDYYFKKKSEMFLAIFKGRTFLFLKNNLSFEERNDCLYQFMEVVFLLQNLLSQRLINLVPCFNKEAVYLMSSEFGELQADNEQNNKLTFSRSNNYIKLNENTMVMYDGYDKIIYEAVEISGEINSFICNVFNSGIFISELLVDFVNNEFMFYDEKISRKNLTAAWWGVGVALVIGLISTIISTLSLCCK